MLIATGLLAGALLEYQRPLLVRLALLASLDVATRVLVTALCSVLAVTALLMKLTIAGLAMGREHAVRDVVAVGVG